MSNNKLTRTIALAGATILLVAALASMPMTNTAFASHRPGHTTGGGGDPVANPKVTGGEIACDDAAGTCAATGSLTGAPKPGGPYTVTAEQDFQRTTSQEKQVGPEGKERTVSPKGHQTEQTGTLSGSQQFSENTNKFTIPLTETNVEGEEPKKNAPNPNSGFEQKRSTTLTGESTFNAVKTPTPTP
jgi:hypothetical protein